jgi:Leucine-rich repeat (LRR) protein
LKKPKTCATEEANISIGEAKLAQLFSLFSLKKIQILCTSDNKIQSSPAVLSVVCDIKNQRFVKFPNITLLCQSVSCCCDRKPDINTLEEE